MKKIVGIIAAVAMAASVFAVDFSAGIQLKGDLFKYDGGNIDVLSLKSSNTKDDKPFIFSVSGDRAGGQVKIFDTADGDKADAKSPMGASAFQVWFKPFDGFQVTLGNTDVALFCESVTYWRGKLFGSSDWGYKATYTNGGLAIDLYLASSATTGWISKTASTAVAQTALVASYNADFGSLKFVFDGEDTFDTLKFGAGYKASFGSSTIFTDVLFTKAATNGLAFDFDYKLSADAFSAELYAAVKATDISNFGDTMTIPLFAKISYALNGGSLYAKFTTEDVTHLDWEEASWKPVAFNLGYDGNLGAIAYEAELNYNLVTKVFSVPFWVRLSF